MVLSCLIFEIATTSVLSLADTTVNLQQTYIYIFHHTLYTVYHKKEPHILVRRKQTSAYKLVQLSSFTGFCWCCWLAILKWWRQILLHNLLFTAQRKQSICSSSRHQTSSRRHFGLQIVQTSTRLITAAGLQPENPKCGRVATAHRWGMGTPGPARNRQRTEHSQTVASTSSLMCGCEGRAFRANVVMCQSDSISSIAWQLWSFIFVKCDTIFKFICCTSQ